MIERIRNNAALKVLSLALAIGAWWYLRFTANPAIAARFDQQLSVPIVTTGLGSDETARFTEKEALITILTPRDASSWQATEPTLPKPWIAAVDLAGSRPISLSPSRMQ